MDFPRYPCDYNPEIKRIGDEWVFERPYGSHSISYSDGGDMHWVIKCAPRPWLIEL